MSIRRAFAALCVVAVVAACGTDRVRDPLGAPATREATSSAEPTVSASTSEAPTSEASTSDTPADDPTHGSASSPQTTPPAGTSEGSGEWDLVLTDVRVADHDGFDRIVLEFSGKGSPGWAVNYVDEAVLDGSGDVVALRGDAVLDIYVSHTTWPASDYYRGPTQFEPPNGADVDDVYVGGTFEGYTQVLAGIDDAAAPFRVFALTDPTRLVVDVDDAGE